MTIIMSPASIGYPMKRIRRMPFFSIKRSADHVPMDALAFQEDSEGKLVQLCMNEARQKCWEQFGMNFWCNRILARSRDKKKKGFLGRRGWLDGQRRKVRLTPCAQDLRRLRLGALSCIVQSRLWYDRNWKLQKCNLGVMCSLMIQKMVVITTYISKLEIRITHK